MATYDPTQSLPNNLQTAGLSELDPRFLSAIETGFARAGQKGYGEQAAFDLVSSADPSRVSSDPLGYANELLQKANIQGFANEADWMRANEALPGHNVPNTLGSALSDPRFQAFALSAGGLANLPSGASSAAGAGAGGGPLMPAAIPEVDPTFGGILTQTSPGVFTNTGNALAFGGNLGSGASSALGLPNPATGAATPTGAPTAASPAASTPGAGATLPSAPPPVAPPPAGGGGFVDSLLKQMKDNALGLGLLGGSMLLAGKPPEMPSQQQLQGLSNEAQATASQLMAQYRAGQLSASQQAGLDQLTQQTKNQVTQYFASIGQADSTAHQQALAQVDQQAFGMRQQMLDNMLTQGLNAIGVAAGPLQTIAQYQLGQDQALRQAYGNFAQGVGNLFGRQAGTPAPVPQQPRPTQPTQTVQSAAQ
jgi:hypothetical protein